MSEPVNLNVIRGERQEKCPWCGAAAHPEPLMCPRIESITLYEDEGSCDIHFWAEYEVEPDDVA